MELPWSAIHMNAIKKTVIFRKNENNETMYQGYSI
jgi:hypothetical protein